LSKIFRCIRNLWSRPVSRILTSGTVLLLLVNILPLDQLWQTITHIPLVLWMFTVAAFLFGHVVGVIKWRLLINTGVEILPFFTALRCYFAGLFANLFLPSIVGGDFVKAGLAIRYRGEKDRVLFGSVIDRFLDTGSLVLIILVGLITAPSSSAIDGNSILVGFLSSALVLIAAFLILLKAPVPKCFPQGLRQVVQRVRELFWQLRKNSGRATLSFLLATAIQSGFVVLNALLGAACQIDLPLQVWFLAWPLAKLAAMLPISVGGLGVREASLAIVLSHYGVPFTSSVALGLCWQSVVVAGGAMGAIFYGLSRQDLAKSKTAVAEEAPEVSVSS
jgi:uncharacterized membrane protein YbhN (UPF0104 family)